MMVDLTALQMGMQPTAAGLWHPLVAMALEAAIVMGSPGPTTMGLTATAVAFGWQRALPYFGGVVAGTTVVLLAVAAGLNATLLSLPGVRPALLLASAVYLLWLAWRIGTAPPLSQARHDQPAPSLRAGLLLAIANPKAYMAIAAVFAHGSASNDAPVLARFTLLAGMILAIHVFWLFAGATMARLLTDPVLSRIANVIFALALVASVATQLMG